MTVNQIIRALIDKGHAQAAMQVCEVAGIETARCNNPVCRVEFPRLDPRAMYCSPKCANAVRYKRWITS